MKNLKIFTSSLLILSLSSLSVMSEITPSTPTNLIQKIASATSFTSTTQNNAQSISQIQNTTSLAIDSKQIRKTVNEDAKKFGLLKPFGNNRGSEIILLFVSLISIIIIYI